MNTKEELETKLMRLGMAGLAYTKLWDETAIELEKLEKLEKMKEKP